MVTVAEQSIQKIHEFREAVANTKYHPKKVDLFRKGFAELNSEEKWLLSFCCWFSLKNQKFQAMEPSKFYCIPAAAEHTGSFREFLQILRMFVNKKITPKKEKVFISFLTKCDRLRQDFYLLILSKKFVRWLPYSEIQNMFDLNGFNVSDVYGEITALKTGFSNLNYPIVIVPITSAKLKQAVYIKDRAITSLNRVGLDFEPCSKHHIHADLKYIKDARYVLSGYLDNSARHRFFVTDFFVIRREFKGYLRLKPATPFPERIANLRRFQENNLLSEINPTYTGFANCEEEILEEVIKVATESEGCDYILLADEDTARTSKAHIITSKVVRGIIEDLWVSGDEVKGLRVWFNSQLLNISYNFKGKNNALLNNELLMRNKLIDFVYIKIGDVKAGVGKEILWNLKTWRPKRLVHSAMRIEKCVLCGGTNAPHDSRGMCRHCYIRFPYHLNKYGVGNWIPPSAATKKKRKKNNWECSALNEIDFVYKGLQVEAREDGCWRFTPIERGNDDSISGSQLEEHSSCDSGDGWEPEGLLSDGISEGD